MSVTMSALSFVAMPRSDSASERTQQVNARLKTGTVEWMERYKDSHHLHPTLTQIIEAAIADFRVKHDAELPPPRKPRG